MDREGPDPLVTVVGAQRHAVSSQDRVSEVECATETQEVQATATT